MNNLAQVQLTFAKLVMSRTTIYSENILLYNLKLIIIVSCSVSNDICCYKSNVFPTWMKSDFILQL